MFGFFDYLEVTKSFLNLKMYCMTYRGCLRIRYDFSAELNKDASRTLFVARVTMEIYRNFLSHLKAMMKRNISIVLRSSNDVCILVGYASV
jgi:hypothetical protein